MQKRKSRVWLLAGAAVVTLMLTFGSCGQVQPGITQEEAITIATQAVVDDGVMTLDGRDTESVEEATYWHIYFPFSSPVMRGGEPHVFVNKTGGQVIDLYYTE